MTASPLSLGFAGTPEIAAVVLKHLLTGTGHRVERVYTQPDRPAGRGRKTVTSPVKQLALEHHLELRQLHKPVEIDTEDTLQRLDVLVVIAYGMILPAKVLQRPRYGCINIHTSLLPRWRGAAPIQRAIAAGDTETGITIIQIEPELDTGPVLAQGKCPILPGDTSGTLHDKLAELGSRCLEELLSKLGSKDLVPVPQDHTCATYASKVSKSEARIDWSRPAIELERLIRAFNPAPVAHTDLNQLQLRIWEAEVINHADQVEPGTIVACNNEGLDIQTGDGVLRLKKIQPAGKKSMTIREFLNGKPDFFRPDRR